MAPAKGKARKYRAATSPPAPAIRGSQTSSEPSPSLRLDRSYIVLFFSALAIRIAVSAELGNTPLFRTPELDSREYWSWAERIAAGNFGWPVPPAHGPGYPYSLGGLLALFDGSAAAVRLVQAALGALLCVVVARIGERTFSRLAGLAAGALLAACGPLVWIDVSILSEGLLVLLIALAFLAASGESKRGLRAAAAGIFLGLATIVRPTAFLFVPALALWVGWPSPGDPRRPLRALLLAGCAVLPVVPVALANANASDRPVLVQGHGGMNFYIGNSPSGTGLPTVRPGQAWDLLESEGIRATRRGPADADAYYYTKTFREIAKAPLDWLRLLAVKTFWTLQADEIRDTFSYAFFRSQSWFLRALPGFGLLVPLAAAGVYASWRGRPGPALPALWLATGIATCVALVVGSRYRIPVAPAAALFAGAGLAALVGPATERLDTRRRAAAAAVLIAAAVFCHLRVHAPSHVFAEEWSATGTALNHEHQLPDAVRAFDRAIAIDPGYAQARVGRGAALLNIGRLEEARDELQRAVAREPSNRSARVELGIALERENRAAEAEPHYRAALALDPNDPATRKTLGANLLRQNRADDAIRELSAVVDRVPDDPTARLWLARAYGAAGRPSEGLPHARQAGRLAPGDGEAWLTAAMLAIGTHDLPGAEADLARAESAGSPGRDTTMARAILFRAERRLDRADGILRPLVLADPGFRPAVELFLENARDRGAESEAMDFLRQVTQRAS